MSTEVAEAVAAMITEAAKAREQRQRDLETARQRLDEFRADHAERRKHGLIARQRNKLRHLQERLI